MKRHLKVIAVMAPMALVAALAVARPGILLPIMAGAVIMGVATLAYVWLYFTFDE